MNHIKIEIPDNPDYLEAAAKFLLELAALGRLADITAGYPVTYEETK